MSPGSPSTVIPPTAAAKRSNRSSARAAPAKMAAPARTTVAPVKKQTPTKTSPRTPKKGPKRKIEEAPRPEDYDPYFHGPGGAPKPPSPAPAEGSSSKRARRADVVVVKYQGTERRARPWRDSPPDSYLDRVGRINKSRYVVICDVLTLMTDQCWVPACSLLANKFGRTMTRPPNSTLMLSGLPATSTKSRLGSCPPATAQMARCAAAESVNISSTVCPQFSHLPGFFALMVLICILLLRSFLLIELCQVLLKALNARPELQYQISFVPSVSRNSISHLIVIMADHLTL